MATKKGLIKLLLPTFLLLLIAFSKANAFPLWISQPDSAPGEPNTTACMNFGEPGFGRITFGLRGGACTVFDPNSIGFGYGAQVRIRPAKHWDIELYGDYFTTNISNLVNINYGKHYDTRIGGNILYYWINHPYRNHKYTPFVLLGISNEYNEILSKQINTYKFQGWAPWVDAGIGEHYNITPRIDLTLEGIYVIPLGVHPASSLEIIRTTEFLNVENQRAFSKGGVFAIISLNYTFGKVGY